ncbi:MAG: tRNA-dihydrouridine synthase [Planctomycetes bacterium]|nr:tRNA-dihydrouridine synthase [Planctomycetota bacterium]
MDSVKTLDKGSPPEGGTTNSEQNASIQIGSRVLPSRYFLAPLAGYTHLAFRRALRELGGLGLATTDLVHATSLVAQNPKALDLIATDAQDRPLSIQIFGSKPDALARAARWLEDHGYEGVDINMGCPMAKVNSQGGGARIACETDSACGLVERVVEAVDIPVTVKMRLGWDADNISAPQLAAAFENLGVKAITIHGRTRAQGFHGSVDRDGIRQVVEAVREIPVIGNGDVRSVKDALAMRRETGCHAVAIGRGAMLDPWIFRKLKEATESGVAGVEQSVSPAATCFVPTEPTPDAQIDFLQRHFWLMTRQHDDYACTLFRKFAGWYGAKLGIPEDLEARLRQFESFDEFESIVTGIRQRHGERESSVATALIKVPNGPVERW